MEKEFQFKKQWEVRVRIAPSPTGNLHIGTARAALFNYIFAKQNKGNFVLRIEDTDRERSKKEFENNIIEGLKWLGLEWNEGPDINGDYGPYRQSERIEIYSKYLEKLISEEKAYYCFCSPEDLEEQRQYQLSNGEAPHYLGTCANLSKKETAKKLADKKPFVIRFKVEPKKIKFNDLIRGDIEFDSALMGDVVIAKNSKTPLYNFAVVVDDFEMRISHVIRGEDHISNTPLQILLQEALGFPRPSYAHLPLILGPNRAKLSKRDGATVSVLDYKEEGYLPEALINFVSFLGWNPGNDREIYSLASLVKEVSVEKFQKQGAIFDIKKLDFLNGFYIRQKSSERLAELCIPYLIKGDLITPKGIIHEENPEALPREIKNFEIMETGEEISKEQIEKIISLEQERMKKLSDIAESTGYFFKDKLKYEKELLKWKNAGSEETKIIIDKLEKILFEIKEGDWSKENLTGILMEEANREGDRGKILWPLRVALTGEKASPGPFEVAEILGKEKTLKRLKEAYGNI